ncbi:MAG: hypothetical protein J7K96_03045 [Desulfobacteraceae bacterium]|nr:hypothetical protein [Desulfobacteraceae bacterium]
MQKNNNCGPCGVWTFLAKTKGYEINWCSIQITDDFTWRQLRELNIKTLEDLDKLNLLNTQKESIVHTIIDKWLFPLYSLDIRIIKTNKNELREYRDQ